MRYAEGDRRREDLQDTGCAEPVEPVHEELAEQQFFQCPCDQCQWDGEELEARERVACSLTNGTAQNVYATYATTMTAASTQAHGIEDAAWFTPSRSVTNHAGSRINHSTKGIAMPEVVPTMSSPVTWRAERLRTRVLSSGIKLLSHSRTIIGEGR
jgi:hypothetical protein